MQKKCQKKTKMPTSWKWPAIEQNGVKCGTLGYLRKYIVASLRHAPVRPCVVMRRSLGASLGCLGGFQLVSPSSSAARSWPSIHYILDFPQSSPSLCAARSTASPTPEYSTTVFQVHRGGSNPLSPLFPSCPDAGGPSSLSPGSVSSVCLPDRPFF